MEDADIRPLLDASDRLVAEVTMDFRRYLFPLIDWKDRLICIKGPKGVGKTTLILQHIRETFGVRSGKAKKMLMVLARDCPQQPNMSALYSTSTRVLRSTASPAIRSSIGSNCTCSTAA